MTPLNTAQKAWIDNEIRDQLHPVIRRMRIRFYITLAAVVIGAMIGVWQIGENSRHDTDRNTQTTRALCTLRDDLQRRVDNSLEFLKEHPDGIPGIPRAVFLAGIRSQQSTVDSLSDLQCKE